MKMLIAAILFITLAIGFPLIAEAGGEGGQAKCNGNHNCNTVQGGNAAAVAVTSSHQAQLQGQVMKGANNASQGVEFNQVYKDRRQAPDIAASSLVASAGTCLGSISGGGSTPGLSLLLGVTLEDKQCQLRRNAALLMGMGQPDAAIRLLCTDEAFSNALGRACGVKKEVSFQSSMSREEYEVYLMGLK